MILLNEKKECCGCGACAESCPARCIRMEEDAEGFLYPAVQADACTGCGLCERICPMRHPAPEHTPSEVWAARNNDMATRTGSSSGGIFLPLARLTLRKGGLVFGAAFESDTFGRGTIRHRSATCEEELAALAKSKYAQSDTSGTFREVARALDQGREVLYTGTPCQIAGLRAFLRGRSTDRLVTAECLCHGAPSPGLLRRYLQELTGGRPILGIDFRDKRDGWRKYRFTVRTACRTYSITARKDAYIRAFLDDWTLRPSCYACPFKSGRSGSDLSLGDFWNVREVLPGSDDDRGTSLVLAYTQSGARRLAELFAATDESGRPAFDSQRLEWDGRIRRRNGGFKTEVEIPAARTALFDELAASERVTRPLSATSGPDGYNGSSGCCIASRHTSTTDPYMKIALLTLPLNSNYGGVLQAFALKSHLTRLGHEVWLIDNRKRLKPVSNAFLKTVLRRAVESLFHPKEIFAEMNTLLTQDYKKSEIEKFIYRRLTPKTQPVFDAADYAELAASGNGFDLYIVGSDQVWRPRYAGDPEPYFFSFLEGSGARRISYAASFGAGDCEYTREQRMRCGELLAGFEGVSVREDTAVGQCREYFGCDRAVHVLDPAMLLTADDYRTLFTAGSAPSDTLYCYLFRVKPGARHILQDFAERHNLRVVRTTDRPNAAQGKMPGIGEWLAGLHEARYVITDSFHACVFCILFHKPFAAYINRSRGSARIHSLLKQFGLESRILSSGLQDISMLDTPIDWEAVDRILERRRAESYAFLDAHLCPASDTVTAAEPDGRAATAKAPAGTGKRIPATKAPLPEIV